MFTHLAIATACAILTLQGASAQDPLGNIPICGAECVTRTQVNRGCVLAIPRCVCPGLPDIRACISKSCPIEDQGISNTLVNLLCAADSTTSATVPSPSPPTPQIPAPPPPPAPSTRQVTVQPPITTVVTAPLPPFSLSIPSTTPTQPTLDLITPSVALSLPPISSETDQGPQTVVVFSTQFNPPAPFSSASSSLSSHNLLMTALVPLFIGISMF